MNALNHRTGAVILAGMWITAAWIGLPAQAPINQDHVFRGRIAQNVLDSIPDWPRSVGPKTGAPNIVVILLDDIGFADTSVFGGPAKTPELERLARRGLRYNNFHTAAMCSPTRAALLTGRNHHRAGFGIVADYAGGFPGYNSVWKRSTASIAEVLRQIGYNTSAFGKWHNTPDWEITPTGPFDRWPTGLGFEDFYGFMGPGGQDNQWEPHKLYRNTMAVDPPATPDQGYHFTSDITDEAIRWLRAQRALASDKPYFLYFAPGAVHTPHHAPKEWVEQYQGKFAQGWDELNLEIFNRQKALGVIPADAKLTPRPKEVPAWNSLTPDQKKIYARQMEVYAGFVAHTDAEIGRLIQAVQSAPGGENTLILYIVGDNGSDGRLPVEGSMAGAAALQDRLQKLHQLGSHHIPNNGASKGWAWASNTPFPYWKTIASHLGGLRSPMVVSWPARIKEGGGLRTQFTHVNDVAATLCEVIGITFPSVINGVEQQPFDGRSFVRTFDEASADLGPRTQYFELMGNRSIYKDGWFASARHEAGWPPQAGADYTRDPWELYDLNDDFSQAINLADKYPEKLKQLQELFDQEARANNVYPLGAGARWLARDERESEKREFVYYPFMRRIPIAALPLLGESSYRLSARLGVPAAGASGIIVSLGDRVNGFVLYAKDDRIIYERREGLLHEVISSRTPLPRGDVAVSFEFDIARTNPTGSGRGGRGGVLGTGRLYINGALAGEAKLPPGNARTDRPMFIGYGGSSPVSTAYVQPFRFTGTLHEVRIEAK